jgi:hypothetical protein
MDRYRQRRWHRLVRQHLLGASTYRPRAGPSKRGEIPNRNTLPVGDTQGERRSMHVDPAGTVLLLGRTGENADAGL